MESSLTLTTPMALLSLTKPLNSAPLICRLNRHFSSAPRTPFLSRIPVNVSCRRNNQFAFYYLPRSLCAANCVSSSAASFASGGGGSGGDNDSSGRGGGGGEGGGGTPNAVAGGADDASVLASDVIILDVRGMTCGGCVASVKRILENQPQVSSASVNLTTETAIVWPVTEAKELPNWRTQLGEALAKHLTSCGFESNLRGQGEGAIEEDASS